MDLAQIKNKAFHALTKHKYAVAVLAVGLVLLLLPLGGGKSQENSAPVTALPQAEDPGRELRQILERIEGAGKVEVLLTYSSGALTVYQEDADLSQGEQGTARYDTVIIRGSDGSESGLIQQIIPAKYLGAVVVCQGAGKPAVKLAIVEAVSRATGLGADQISVLKMK